MKSNKKNILILLFIIITLLFSIIIYLTIDGKNINEIKEFVGTDIKLLYITHDESLNYPEKIMDKYSIDYLKVNSSKLTIFEKKKLESIIGSKYIKNNLIIFENGSIKDALIEYENESSVNKFLQENGIIPEILVDHVEKIIKDSQKILENTYAMIYIPYKNIEDIEEQDSIFKEISKKYSIDYLKIDAYLLSFNQQEKINKLLGLSLVENQILVLVKDNKMIANIRGVHSKNTYIESLYSANFIDELESRFNEIDYDAYKKLLNNSKKNIILISSDTNEDKKVKDILNKIIYNYNIEINNINIQSSDDYLYKKVREKIENIGYDGGFSTPLFVIVEGNKVLDYIIGNSTEEYFIDVLIENGAIKGDVINE